MQNFSWLQADKLSQNLTKAIHWAEINIVSWSTFGQIGCIIAAIVAGSFLSTPAARWFAAQVQKRRPPLGFVRIHASNREIFFLIFTLMLLWLATLIAQGAHLPYAILQTVATLASVWAIIRFTSSTIESDFLARLVAVSLWLLAALSIFGWLKPAINLADRAAFSVGSIRLSVLFLIKSLAAYGILFWLVRLGSAVLERSFMRASGLTPSQRALFNKLSTITLYAVAIIIGLNIVGLDLTSLAVFSGALGLGIGFGLQKVVSNLISGIILLMDKSIKPGDVIAVGDTYGWVNSLGARCISVLTRDGIRDHAFFEQTVFERQVSDAFLQSAGFTPQVLHLVGGRRPGGIPRQPPLADFHELLRPCVIQALDDAFLTAQLGDAILAAQAFQHDPDLVFGGIVFACRSADVPYDPLGRGL